MADRLAREIPGAWRPNQFANLANPEVHYRSTGPGDLGADRRQDHRLRRGRRHRRHDLRRRAFSQGAGSRRSGSSAPTRRARSSPAMRPSPGRSRGSARTSSPRRSTARSSTSGSASATPRASARPATGPARRPARRRLGGHRRGRGLRYARRLTADDVVVVLCPDTGRNYLSKFFDDGWMAENKLLRRRAGRRRPSATCSRSAARGRCRSVGPDARRPRPSSGCRSRGISQLPVLQRRRAGRQHPGSHARPAAARRRRPDAGSASATSWPGRCRRSTSASTSTRPTACCWRATRACWRRPDGAVVDIVTRIDLIPYWNRARGRA